MAKQRGGGNSAKQKQEQAIDKKARMKRENLSHNHIILHCKLPPKRMGTVGIYTIQCGHMVAPVAEGS